jgi:hypothetical protein
VTPARGGPAQADGHEQARQERRRAQTPPRGATDERLAHLGPDPSVAAGRRRDHHHPPPQPPALTRTCRRSWGPGDSSSRTPDNSWREFGRTRRRASTSVTGHLTERGAPASSRCCGGWVVRGRPGRMRPVSRCRPTVHGHVCAVIHELAATRQGRRRAPRLGAGGCSPRPAHCSASLRGVAPRPPASCGPIAVAQLGGEDRRRGAGGHMHPVRGSSPVGDPVTAAPREASVRRCRRRARGVLGGHEGTTVAQSTLPGRAALSETARPRAASGHRAAAGRLR